MFKKYKKFSKIYSFKDKICYEQTLSNSFPKFKFDPIYELLSCQTDINDIIKFEKIKLIEFIYCNRKKIEDILYEYEEVIQIKEDWINDDDMSNYFYLSSLVRNNPTIINYVYNINIIRNINKYCKKDNLNSLKNILIRKILFELINNYRSNDYDESESEELNEIEKENLISIENNINIFNQFDLYFKLKDFLAEKIDSIYIRIIIFLIKNKKIDDSKNVTKLFEELDLNSIKLTKLMIDKLNNELTKERNRDILENYEIINSDDLSKQKKINFFYILFNYILKDSIYIYYNDFLKTIRLNLIKIFKNSQGYFKEMKN